MSGFDLTRWALDKRFVAGTVFALVAAAGALSYPSMPRAEDPGFIVRQAVIVTEFPGASAERVEALVTDPLEEGLQKLVGVDFVKSTSRAGQSVIVVSAEETLADVPAFWDEMRERVEEQARVLPPEAIGPFVDDDFGDVYGTLLALTGDGFALAELEDVAEDLRRALLRIPDVAKVELVGVAGRRIFLEYDEARLAELGTGPRELAAALRARNIVSPSGRVRAGDRVFEVEAEGSYRAVDELARTLVDLPGQGRVPLGRLVEVREGYADHPGAPSMSFTGRPAVGLAVSMAPGGKLTELGPEVRRRVDGLVADLPVGLEVHLASYQAAVVETAVADFVGNLLESVLIVLCVMLVALGFRTGLIVGAMVPMTILATFTVMGMVGIGIDKMSLTALIIALGLLVDNGIVISESILVKQGEGVDLVRASLDTAAELKVPLLISSVTTVAALLPTYLAESTTGEYTAPIAEVVAIALMASWVLSLTFVPLLCVVLARRRTPAAETPATEKVARARYRRFLTGLVRHRGAVLVGAVLVLVGSGALMSQVPQQFFPGKAWPQLTVEIELPEGTPRARTAAVTADVERFFAERFIEDDWSEALASEKVAGHARRADVAGLVSWSAFVGQGAPRFILGYTPEQPKENFAYFVVNVENYAHIRTVLAEIRDYIAERYPEATSRVLPLRNGPPLQYPVEIRLSGDDVDTLHHMVAATEARLREIPGLTRIGNDWGPDRPRVVVDIDPVRLSQAGLTNADVAAGLDTAFRGRVQSVFRDGTDIVPIELRRRDAPRAGVEDLRSVSVSPARGGRPVPLLQVADVRVDFAPPVRHRRDRQRTVTVRADLAPDAPRSVTAFSVAAQMEDWLTAEQAGWPFGYGWAFGGEVESSGKANASVEAKQPIALLVIVLCLVFQFNTLREPLIVLLTLPFAITGVALGLFVTQKPFGFMALLGVIALVGIVINNAIVLLDRVQLERAAGRTPLEALLNASEQRLRPILLTAATTVAGLIPLAISGGPLFSPMAVALLGGLVVSTGLTLGLVPVLYAVLHRLPRPPRADAPTPVGGAPGARAVAAGLGLVLFGLSAGVAAAPLTADEAARRAAARAVDVDRAQAALRGAQAELDGAEVALWPTLALGASYARLSDLTPPSLFGDGGTLVVTRAVSGPLDVSDLAPLPADAGRFPVFLNQVNLSASVVVPLSRYALELVSALEASSRGVAAAELAVEVARVDAAARARLAFYGLVGAQRQAEVFRQRVVEAQERLRVTGQRRAAGGVADTEVLEAESALARAETDLARAEEGLALARESVRQALRDDASATYEVGGVEALPAPAALPPTARLVDRAWAQRREVRRVVELVAAAEARADGALGATLPSLEGYGTVLAANPNPRFVPNRDRFDATWEVGVRLAWTPNQLFGGRAAVRGAEARAAELRAGLAGLRLQVRREVVAAREAVRRARVSLRSAVQGLAAAEGAYRRRTQTFEAGAATLLDVLQTESTLVGARIGEIQARLAVHTAAVRLARATGDDAAGP